MLPSMPILYTRDSQDAFGNKIEPSTSYFNQNNQTKTIFQSETLPTKEDCKQDDEKQNEAKNETNIKKEELSKPKDNDNVMETALVKLYFRKIQSRFGAQSTLPTNKFVQFKEILKTFDPSKATPVDLYRNVEQLFGSDHKDILEEFLLFLKPCQAAAVGRFMDYFVLTQMTGFIKLLQVTFIRKPTVLRKIMRALTTGINSGNSAAIKSRVLPHLRPHPRLTQMFMSLFPDERPPDSLYDKGVDVVEDSFLESDAGYDVWEFEDEDTERKAETKVLDSKYLHGRVFLQHGRFLRTAYITYPYSKEPYRSHARCLTPDHCHSPPQSDSEKALPKRNSKNNCKVPQKRSRKQLKVPTKSGKDVNDNTKKECLTNPLQNTKVKGKSHPKPKQNKKEDTLQKKKEVANKSSHTKRDDELKMKHNKEMVKVENRNWTRDEDKTMLEVLKGGPGSEQVFVRIRQLLPHRTKTEIKKRFCHVMNLLQQMAVGEVT